MPITTDVQKLDLGQLVDFYILDLTVIGGVDVFRFHPGVNTLGNDVVWQGNTYTRWPMIATGYELSGKGVLPRPNIRVANIDGTISQLCKEYADMVGAKITRLRTLAKYLDAVNFEGGVNPSADPEASYPNEVYFINRKVDQNRVFIAFELTAAWDVTGVQLPRGQIVQNSCPWLYRGSECGYAGTNYFNILDEPVATLAEDVCGKRLTSCKKRFGEHADLPYGAFPVAWVS